MISTTHITTGAAVGLAVVALLPNPVLALPIAFGLGLVSHHILDMIPHTDPGSFRSNPNDVGPAKPKELLFAIPDNLIGTAIILAVFLTRQPSWPMLLGAAGGNMPDVWHNVGLWSDYTRKKIWPGYFTFHETNHSTARGNLIPLGIVTNLVLILGSLYFILHLS